MAKSFLKKVVDERPDKVPNRPVFDKKHDAVFVNADKYNRAIEILNLLRGVKVAVKTDDVERRDHYAKQLAMHEIDIKSEEAVPALYELLGGLIRTPKEQEEADKKAMEAQKKGKKRMIE